MNFDSPTLRGWQGFTKLPNSSPSGKRVDYDDPFPQKPLNLGKNFTLRASEWTRVLRKIRNSRIEVGSWNYPLGPMNREVHTIDIFHWPLVFSELFSPSSTHQGFSWQRFWNFKNLLTLEGTIPCFTVMIFFILTLEFMNLVSHI
jgi:hypothetical protein